LFLVEISNRAFGSFWPIHDDPFNPVDGEREPAEKYLIRRLLKNGRCKAPGNLYPPPAGRGMRRTFRYVAVTRDEGNAADGRFSADC
jgi:hypothetical protein